MHQGGAPEDVLLSDCPLQFAMGFVYPSHILHFLKQVIEYSKSPLPKALK